MQKEAEDELGDVTERFQAEEGEGKVAPNLVKAMQGSGNADLLAASDGVSDEIHTCISRFSPVTFLAILYPALKALTFDTPAPPAEPFFFFFLRFRLLFGFVSYACFTLSAENASIGCLVSESVAVQRIHSHLSGSCFGGFQPARDRSDEPRRRR